MKRYAISATVAALSLAFASAQESPWEFFGSETVSASMTIDGNFLTGAGSETHLGIEYLPETGPTFRAEGSFVWGFGSASREAIAFDSGLASSPTEGSLPPGTDLHRAFRLDQAWAKFSLGPVDAKFGVVPVSWGSGYVFNPVSRTTGPVFPGTEGDVQEGRMGAVSSVAFLNAFSLEVYALGEPRVRYQVPRLSEIAPANVPFGARFLARTEAIDISASFTRSLMTSDAAAEWRAGIDATGFIGPVTVYAEGAARVLAKDGDSFRDFDPWKDIDACAGFSYLVPFIETTVRSEIALLGDGADTTGGYDRAGVASGSRATIGKAYVFGMAEKEIDDRWKAEAGALVNLVDASAAWFAVLTCSPIAALEFSLSGSWFSGNESSEFGGSMPTGVDSSWDPFKPAISLSAKASF